VVGQSPTAENKHPRGGEMKVKMEKNDKMTTKRWEEGTSRTSVVVVVVMTMDFTNTTTNTTTGSSSRIRAVADC